VIDRVRQAPAAGLHRGGYTLWESANVPPTVILIATGSEVQIALEAGQQLSDEGIGVRVVSLPSWEAFDSQPAEYRESVLPDAIRARVAVEAGSRIGWEHYVGLDGAVVGMDTFGASAPAEVLYEKFGITAESVVAHARALLRR
jgi:transketolase